MRQKIHRKLSRIKEWWAWPLTLLLVASSGCKTEGGGRYQGASSYDSPGLIGPEFDVAAGKPGGKSEGRALSLTPDGSVTDGGLDGGVDIGLDDGGTTGGSTDGGDGGTTDGGTDGGGTDGGTDGGHAAIQICPLSDQTVDQAALLADPYTDPLGPTPWQGRGVGPKNGATSAPFAVVGYPLIMNTGIRKSRFGFGQYILDPHDKFIAPVPQNHNPNSSTLPDSLRWFNGASYDLLTKLSGTSSVYINRSGAEFTVVATPNTVTLSPRAGGWVERYEYTTSRFDFRTSAGAPYYSYRLTLRSDQRAMGVRSVMTIARDQGRIQSITLDGIPQFQLTWQQDSRIPTSYVSKITNLVTGLSSNVFYRLDNWAASNDSYEDEHILLAGFSGNFPDPSTGFLWGTASQKPSRYYGFGTVGDSVWPATPTPTQLLAATQPEPTFLQHGIIYRDTASVWPAYIVAGNLRGQRISCDSDKIVYRDGHFPAAATPIRQQSLNTFVEGPHEIQMAYLDGKFLARAVNSAAKYPINDFTWEAQTGLSRYLLKKFEVLSADTIAQVKSTSTYTYGDTNHPTLPTLKSALDSITNPAQEVITATSYGADGRLQAIVRSKNGTVFGGARYSYMSYFPNMIVSQVDKLVVADGNCRNLTLVNQTSGPCWKPTLQRTASQNGAVFSVAETNHGIPLRNVAYEVFPQTGMPFLDPPYQSVWSQGVVGAIKKVTHTGVTGTTTTEYDQRGYLLESENELGVALVRDVDTSGRIQSLTYAGTQLFDATAHFDNRDISATTLPFSNTASNFGITKDSTGFPEEVTSTLSFGSPNDDPSVQVEPSRVGTTGGTEVSHRAFGPYAPQNENDLRYSQWLELANPWQLQ